MIKLTNLTKIYGEKIALSDLTLNIPEGELFGFLGPNGAGKTTTIKLIMGLLRPTSGKVEVGGYDIFREPIKAKQIIGYVPDSPFIYEKLTGREYLQFIGSIFNMEVGNIAAEIEKCSALLNMESYLDYRTGEYSHGMRQKVVLTSAFIHKPRLLIIDEPMVGLDPSSARIVKDILADFAKAGSTVFISTHTLSLAEEICHRIGIINHGRLVTVGTRADLMKMTSAVDGNLETLFLKLTAGFAPKTPIFS